MNQGLVKLSVEPTEPSVEAARDTFLRTEFLDRVAHELRGPAGVTLGALDELELALGQEAEGHRPLLAMARRGALRVLRTADRLTRAAQLEAGSAAFVRAPTDVRELVKRACAEAELLEGRAHVKVTLVQPDAPCIAAVDSGWLQAAVIELVAQALRLASREVRVELTAPALLRVTNDGSSADPVSLRFEERADRRDTGLAIPLVSEVANAHGGCLTIERRAVGMSAALTFARA